MTWMQHREGAHDQPVEVTRGEAPARDLGVISKNGGRRRVGGADIPRRMERPTGEVSGSGKGKSITDDLNRFLMEKTNQQSKTPDEAKKSLEGLFKKTEV